jgi:ADP-heptose:LPS heptosyltransferase
MGDVAMTVPVLLALQKQYPKTKITVLTKAFFEPILSKVPNVKVYAAEVKDKHKGVFGLWKLHKELSNLKIDAVVDLHNVLRSNILKQFFRISSVPFYQLDKGRQEKKALTAHQNKIFKPLKQMHERYADVFRNCGFNFQLVKEAVLPKMDVSPAVALKLGLTANKTIGIATFAAFEGKMYPLELMEEVVSSLAMLEGYQILLFGGGEKEQKQLQQWANTHENCVNVAGKISFPEELTIISKLNLMLSMDSGNAHLAAMYGVPVVSLWGVTHPYSGFYPFGQEENNALLADREQYPMIPTSVYGNKVPSGYEKVMQTIKPTDVVKKIKSVLKID